MCGYESLLLIVKMYFAGMAKRKKRFIHNYSAVSFLGKESEPQSSSISRLPKQIFSGIDLVKGTDSKFRLSFP